LPVIRASFLAMFTSSLKKPRKRIPHSKNK
jgi:hypothetical protein